MGDPGRTESDVLCEREALAALRPRRCVNAEPGGGGVGSRPARPLSWKQRGPSRRRAEDAVLSERVTARHGRAHGTYGAPRIRADPREVDGLPIGRRHVARLMRAVGLKGVHRRAGHGHHSQKAPPRPGPARQHDAWLVPTMAECRTYAAIAPLLSRHMRAVLALLGLTIVFTWGLYKCRPTAPRFAPPVPLW
ncbi:IS3 family transposase [Streptomyces sp. PU-14G]|uniref:IS3 family transposase n=1 Tax=Streptomyces sp. PU-14G TaxID=2800808 RepID=UPI0034DF4AFF